MADAESIAPELVDYFLNSVDLLSVFNSAGEMGLTNPAWFNMLGWDAESMQQIKYIDLVHPDDAERTNLETELVVHGPESTRVGFENRLRCRDGSYRYIEWTSQRRGDWFYSTGRDVTLRNENVAQMDRSIKITNAIFAAAADSIIVVDEDMVIAESSPAGQQIFGFPDQGLIGSSALTVVHRDDHEKVLETFRGVFDHREIKTVRFRARHANGRWMTVEARGQALQTEAGSQPLAVIITRDVTKAVEEEAALAAGLAKITAIFDTAVDAITTIDRDLMIVDSSPGGEDALGVVSGERQGLPALERIHPDDHDIVLEGIRRVFEDQEIATVRFRIQHSDGHWLTVESRGRALDNGDEPPVMAVVTTRDISESVMMERALEAAKAEAERANLAKSDFLSRMSHELRTPLNSVLGFAQILQMEFHTPDELEIVDHIYTSGQHLLNLINEVLDITRVESGQISVSLNAVPLRTLIDQSVNIVSPLANERGVEIAGSDQADVEVLADPHRLRQVLINLLSNAVKYNRASGTVTLSCDTVGDRLRISITDTGPGITPDLIDRLFVPFDRLNAESLGIEGTGLGLALSKSLTEAMGGTVGVESVVDVGSTFWVELPLFDPVRHASLVSPSEGQTGSM